MKRHFFISFVLFAICLSATAQLKVHSSGGISLGTTSDPGSGKIDFANPLLDLNINGVEMTVYNGYYGPQGIKYQCSSDYFQFDLGPTSYVYFITDRSYFYFNRDIRANGVWLDSDETLKKDILKLKDIGSSYEIIRNLEGIKYKLQDESNTNDYVGFLAQDLREVLPELVYEDEDGILTVNYIGVIPHLVEAMKEQQSQIESLEKEISQRATSKIAMTSLAPSAIEPVTTSVLEPNIPNPFNEETHIKFHIAEDAISALINVYDLQGKQIMSHNVVPAGPGEICIHSTELDPGIYIYNLIVDGREVDAKRMILTE